MQEGVAVLVDGRVVAWFENFDKSAEQWCTDNHFGRWLAWKSHAPSIAHLTKDENDMISKRASDMAAYFDGVKS
jgi:hypothetical protein